MRYIFLTQLFNLEISTKLNKGKEIRPGARITNNNEQILSYINLPIFKDNIGYFSRREFVKYSGSHYIVRGELNISSDKIDEEGNKYCFYFLREIQSFINELWYYKDNNVYVRDGFLLLYKDKVEDGLLYRASLSEVFTKSDLSKETTVFTTDELDDAVKSFKADSVGISSNTISASEVNIDKWKYPSDFIFRQKEDTSSLDRIIYNVLGAKRSSLIPMKVLFYCAALESLFSNKKTTKIAHGIAEGVAEFIGKDSSEKEVIYREVKKAYNVRSIVIHGSFFKEREIENIPEISRFLDSILRRVFNSPKLEKLHFTKK